MPLVTITYKAWDHDQDPIPMALQPRVGFRPVKTSLAFGLMTDREVWGTIDAEGAGSVTLLSEPDVFYVPFIDWLTDRSQTGEDVENRARGYAEWDAIYPGEGGKISELPPPTKFAGFLYGLGDPPQYVQRRNDVIYIDISGSGDGYWQPWVPEGTYVEA